VLRKLAVLMLFGLAGSVAGVRPLGMASIITLAGSVTGLMSSD
jgi:hypothetical protein